MGINTTSNLSLETVIGDGIDRNDSVALIGANTDNMTILEKAIAGVQTAATTGVNASIVDTNGNRIVLMQMLSAGCIATITGMFTGVPFTLIYQSSGSIGIVDTGVFKLAGNLVGAVNTAITLVWDGTNYIELGRSANG